jgi:uncharacterized membrane protein
LRIILKKSFLLLFILLLVAGIPASTLAAHAQSAQAVVKTILFWSNGCPHCEEVLTNTLPPLQDKYQAQLTVLLVELVTLEDIQGLYTLGSELGLPKERVGVPFMLLGDTALVGADDIREHFAGLVDQYLSAGGLEYPDLPPLNGVLARGVPYTTFDPETLFPQQAATDTPDIDKVLAWVVMAFMGVALVVSIAMVLRAFNGRPVGKVSPWLSPWLNIAIPLLSVIGVGISLYLAYVELTQSRAICGPVGDCNAVQSSPYAKLFGVVPIGVVGIIGYIAILGAWWWHRYRKDALASVAGPIMFGMALFGTLFSVYLTYLEIFVIHAVCIWCLSSAVLMAALMLLSLPFITQWLAVTEEEEQPVA